MEKTKKLIFITWAMMKFSYLQTLRMYKKNIERLGGDSYFK